MITEIEITPEILAQHNLKLSDIQAVIGTLRPLEGALDFLRTLRSTTQAMCYLRCQQKVSKPCRRMATVGEGWRKLQNRL